VFSWLMFNFRAQRYQYQSGCNVHASCIVENTAGVFEWWKLEWRAWATNDLNRRTEMARLLSCMVIPLLDGDVFFDELAVMWSSTSILLPQVCFCRQRT